MARLVISTQSLQVLASDRSIFSVLGYHPQEVNGQNVLTFTGLRSDPRMLQSAILGMDGQKMQIILYDPSGCERRLIISCTQFQAASFCVSCLLALCPSEAIGLQEAFAEIPQACILISADPPHTIHMANVGFLNRYQCATSGILGRPLNIVYGAPNFPSHEFAQATESDTAWRDLLHTALDGRVAKRPPTASDSSDAGGYSDEVTLAPVVEAPNGRIRHLLVTFGPSRSDPEPVEPPVAPDESGFLVCPHLFSAGPAIVPRGKFRRQSALAPAAPVVVTRELIAALADLPVRQAAAAAGVSATAFKKACRKLGVARWRYKRRGLTQVELADDADAAGTAAADEAGPEGGGAEGAPQSGTVLPAPAPGPCGSAAAGSQGAAESDGWPAGDMWAGLCADDIASDDGFLKWSDCAVLGSDSAAAAGREEECPAPDCPPPGGLMCRGGL